MYLVRKENKKSLAKGLTEGGLGHQETNSQPTLTPRPSDPEALQQSGYHCVPTQRFLTAFLFKTWSGKNVLILRFYSGNLGTII